MWFDFRESSSLSKLSTVFLLLVFGQFPLVLFMYRTQLSPLHSSYAYSANYYKSLTAELTGSIWSQIRKSSSSSISIQFIKKTVQEFVQNLEAKDEGIKDRDEYDEIIADLASFLREQSGVSAELLDNVVPRSAVVHNYTAPTECAIDPPKLQGLLGVDVNQTSGPLDFETIHQRSPALKEGGHWSPAYCNPRNRVAIIIPYRDRLEHLQYFLMYMHKILQRQELDYQIYVVNQVDSNPFNRAKLLNVGFVESLKQYDWQCFVFHDVDLILENDKCLYRCPEMPRHISVAIDKYKYRLPYYSIFGGITSMTVDHMVALNGYSNRYWGWGGEDDDMFARVRSANLKILRPSPQTGRFKMIRHLRESSNTNNPDRFKLLKGALERMSVDGLNSLKYTVREIHSEWTHTMIDVDLGEPEKNEFTNQKMGKAEMNFRF